MKRWVSVFCKLFVFCCSWVLVTTSVYAATPNDYYVTNGSKSYKPYENVLFTPNNFVFYGFSEGTGSYQIIIRPASSSAQLVAEDIGTHDNIHVNSCPGYGLPVNSYKSACFTVYATNDQIINFTYSDSQYNGGEAVLTQDYFPDNPNNVDDADWLKWAYNREFSPVYASAFYGFNAAIGQVGQETAERIMGLQVIDAVAGVATAGLSATTTISSQFTDPDTGADVVKYAVNFDWSNAPIDKVDDIFHVSMWPKKGPQQHMVRRVKIMILG